MDILELFYGRTKSKTKNTLGMLSMELKICYQNIKSKKRPMLIKLLIKYLKV